MSGSVVHRKEICPQKKIESGRLIGAYQEWLQAMNYAKESVERGPSKVRAFFDWVVVENKIKTIDDITDEVVRSYFEYLENRINKRTGQGFSLNTLRTYQVELRRFSRYLSETNQGHIEVSIELKSKGKLRPQVEIFTTEQIEKLYETCADDLLGIRDRAMLSVFYGCGLRRNEGASLEVKDVQFNRSVLHVRKGKNYKQRYVPMVGRVRNDLQEYLKYSRPMLENNKTANWLFVSYRGGTVSGTSLGERFNKLKKLSDINHDGSLHALRHSIATHLLEAGMTLENIARFLGHNSLESTQIYTHVLQTKV